MFSLYKVIFATLSNSWNRIKLENNGKHSCSVDDKINDILNKENPLIVILDHIEDPHNFGAIIRTCEAAGVEGIIIPKDRSVNVNDTVVKVSVGAIEHVKIII